ncbi:MAG TPA: hypothetical protein VML54_11735, partial [Candidatus Limnocylindrales bacterium]|nr:hypothetical protein [Candidatus Limnocylindrales bacterium]
MGNALRRSFLISLGLVLVSPASTAISEQPHVAWSRTHGLKIRANRSQFIQQDSKGNIIVGGIA